MKTNIFYRQILALLAAVNNQCEHKEDESGEGFDTVAAGLLDRSGNAILISGTQPLLCSMLLSAANLKDRLEVLGAGDILVTNHPELCGFHPNAILAIAPFYTEDSQKPDYFIATALWIHSLPIQYFDLTARIHEHDFITLPPVLLVEEGELNQQVTDLMLINHGDADLLKQNLNSMITASAIAVKRLEKLITRWGKSAFSDNCAGLLHLSREACRATLLKPLVSDTLFDFVELQNQYEDYQKLSVRFAAGSRGINIEIGSACPDSGMAHHLSPVAIRAAVLEAFLDGAELNTLLNASVATFLSFSVENPALLQKSFLPEEASSAFLYQRLVDLIRTGIMTKEGLPAHRIDGAAPVRLAWFHKNKRYLEMVPSGYCHGQQPGKATRFALFSGLPPASVEQLEVSVPAIVLEEEFTPEGSGNSCHRGIRRAVTAADDLCATVSLDRLRYPCPGTENIRSGRTAAFKINARRKNSSASFELPNTAILDITSASGCDPHDKEKAGC